MTSKKVQTERYNIKLAKWLVEILTREQWTEDERASSECTERPASGRISFLVRSNDREGKGECTAEFRGIRNTAR